MKQKFGRHFQQHLLIFSLFKLCCSISVMLNTASNYSFQHSIIKAEVVNLQGTQFVYILFSNGTISKLDSHLQFNSIIISQDRENITDFQVCNNKLLNQNTPTLMVTVSSQTKWKLISLIDHNLQFDFTDYSEVKKVFCLAAYYPNNNHGYPIFKGTVYYQDMIARIDMEMQQIQTLYTLNYSCTEDTERQSIKKAVQTKYQGNTYEVSIVEKGDRVVTFYPLQSKLYNSYQSLASSGDLRNFNIDGQSIFFLEKDDASTDTQTFLDYTRKVIFNQNFKFDGIKAIRPRYQNDGLRVFFYHNYSALVNLSLKTYILKEVSSNYYFSDDSELGFAVFTSGHNSFAYEVNTPTIYSYCESMQVYFCQTTINLPLSRSVSFCTLYDSFSSLCSLCEKDYFLQNHQCLKIQNNCSALFCTQCLTNGTCLACENSYQLNLTTKNCDQIPITENPDSKNNETQSNNKTNNQTNNNQNLLPQPNPSEENYTRPKITIQVKDNQPLKTWPVFSKDTINNQMLSFDSSFQGMAIVSTKMNSSPLLRLLLGFMSPLFSLFDDYWFYIYHENSWDNLVLFPNFLVFMYTVNQERILPDQLRFNNMIQLIKFSQTQQFAQYTPQRIMEVDEQIIYTAYNFQEIILRQFPFLIIWLLLIKLISALIRKICLRSNGQEVKRLPQKKPTDLHSHKEARKQQKKSIQVSRDKAFLNGLNSIFEDIVSFKSIILTFLGSNIIFFSFKLSSQLRSFFAFKFIDSINMVLTVFFGFSLILAFVILITLSESLFPSFKISKNEKKELLMAKKREIMRLKYIDLNTVVFSGIKCIFFGFIHGFFIGQNTLQYILLFTVKFLLIGVILMQRKIFQLTSLSVANLLYYFSGILIDLTCLASKQNLIPKQLLKVVFQDYCIMNIIEICLLVILIGSITGGVFYKLLFQLNILLCNKDKKQKNNLELKKANILSVFNKVSPMMNDLEDNPKYGVQSQETKKVNSKYVFVPRKGFKKWPSNQCRRQMNQQVVKFSRFFQKEQQKFSQKKDEQKQDQVQNQMKRKKCAISVFNNDRIIEKKAKFARQSKQQTGFINKKQRGTIIKEPIKQIILKIEKRRRKNMPKMKFKASVLSYRSSGNGGQGINGDNLEEYELE